MKIHVLSDLHVEFEDFTPPATNADAIILAGDIHVAEKGVKWAKEKFPTRPVLYVLGNHEYYGKAFPKHLADLKELTSGSDIYILENDSVEIDGVCFLGCTLWTDFNLFGNPIVAGYTATQQMNDYRKIRVSPVYRKLRSIDTATIHAKSRRWLEGCLRSRSVSSGESHYSSSIVVVTHHAPSRRSLPENYTEDILSAAYTSDLDELVSHPQLKLWIHGHIHKQQDYSIGETRVICNPRGYPLEINPDFQPDLLININ